MPHRNDTFPKSTRYPRLGPPTLSLLLTLLAACAGGAEEKEAEKAPDAAHSAVPVRARDYIDDYAELNAQREGVVSLPSGVQYEVLRAGSGNQPHASDTVTVHYRAMLANGVEFDNTYERGEPASLHLGEYLVPGLKEALLLMKEGDEWRVTIPAKMGFRGGRLLRKRDLIYEIALIAIETAPPSKPQP